MNIYTNKQINKYCIYEYFFIYHFIFSLLPKDTIELSCVWLIFLKNFYLETHSTCATWTGSVPPLTGIDLRQTMLLMRPVRLSYVSRGFLWRRQTLEGSPVWARAAVVWWGQSCQCPVSWPPPARPCTWRCAWSTACPRRWSWRGCCPARWTSWPGSTAETKGGR